RLKPPLVWRALAKPTRGFSRTTTKVGPCDPRHRSGHEDVPVEFQDVVRRRRMVRSFQDRPLPDGALDRILSAALRAPSAGHTQGVDYVVLQGDETRVFWEHGTDPDWRSQPSLPGLLNAPA